MKKFDHLLIGVGVGIVMSIISLCVFYLMKFEDKTVGEYLHILFINKGLFAPLVSMAGIPNLVVFYLFINREKYKTARGLILATFLLVVAVLLIKVLL